MKAIEGLILAGVALCAASGVFAEIKVEKGIFYDTDDREDGVKMLPPGESTWRSGLMSTRRYDVKDTLWTAEDYFKLEYGTACDFAQGDILAKIGGETTVPSKVVDGALEFETGAKGAALLLGAQPQRESIPPFRIGACYGRHIYEHLILELTVDNGDDESSEWRIDRMCMRKFAYLNDKPFTIKGKGVQTHAFDFGFLRKIYGDYVTGGLRIHALSPNRRARILKVAIAPKSADVNWRYAFDLPFVPERAPFTYQVPSVYDLYVNGQRVKAGSRLPKTVMPTVDLAPFLVKGRNVIGLKVRFIGSWMYNSAPAQLLMEGAAIGPGGEIVRILGGTDWRYAFNHAASDWLAAGFDASAWAVPKVGRPQHNFRNQTRYMKQVGFAGINPAHMGILEVAPAAQKYPVFEKGERIVYSVKLPSAMRGLSGKVEIVNAETDETVGTRAWTEQDGTLDLGIAEPGAYWLKWQVSQGGQVIDARKTELVIAGPLGQTEVPYKDFESYLAQELTLEHTIDFTAKNPSATDFIEFRKQPAGNPDDALVTTNGVTYRETGPTRCDSFSYRMPRLELGRPYLIEVEIPDDRSRYVYTRIIESYPAGFSNNDGRGATGHPAASGTSATGGEFPLTGKTKTIRYVYVPGSRRATITVENGAASGDGLPAAAIKANVYSFKSIPALRLPDGGEANGRAFGQHTERSLLPQWNAAYNVSEAGYNMGFMEHVGQWIALYRSLKTYIQMMRLHGYNMIMQGAYMYKFGIPIDRYCDATQNDGFDVYLLFLKMYRQNKIAMYMVMEFLHPYFLYVENDQEFSDRQIWEKRGRGIYSVDKNGNQVICINGSGINPFSPQFQKGFKEMMTDIYRRYDGNGLKGMMFVTGNWWMPAISISTMRHLTIGDVSFDDDTIEQFEADTGIALNADAPGRERFRRRYELLTGQYERQWNDWRVGKIRALWKEVEAIFSSGRDKWEIIVKVGPSFSPADNPYLSLSSTYADRTDGMLRQLEKGGYRESLYTTPNLRLMPSTQSDTYERVSDSLACRGISESTAMAGIVRRQDAVYSGGTSLNETGTPRQGCTKPWWWEVNHFTGSLKRPAGGFEFAKEVRTTRDFMPRILVDNWMDNQVCMSHDNEVRRFAQAFYATPRLDWKTTRTVCGADVSVAGNHMRVVNASRTDIRGALKFAGTAQELVFEREFRSGEEIVLRPMDQMVFRFEGAAQDVSGRFDFDAAHARHVVETGRELLKSAKIRKRVAAAAWEELADAYARKDAYQIERCLDGYEIRSRAEAFYESKPYLANQRELEKQLKETGVARINAAGDRVADKKGDVWLPDQPYTGYGAYGSEFMRRADRDPANPVKDTAHPEIYFTEAFGATVFYTLPLPAGEYDIVLYAAETYPWNEVKGRSFNAEVNGERKVFDLYKMTPGYLHEAKHVWKVDVKPEDPVIIKLTGETGLNGIEIRKRN